MQAMALHKQSPKPMTNFIPQTSQIFTPNPNTASNPTLNPKTNPKSSPNSNTSLNI